MNDLQRIGRTESGDALFMFPLDGCLFYFSKVDHSTLSLHAIDTLAGAQTDLDTTATFDELPKPVRAAISRSNYRMRSTKASFAGVLSHSD